ncbi:MAG: hypothetical protein JW894_13815 [Bacteroidales bacterium]|nr:hypothetical protein [Bacteroidales bacterium]
MDKVYQYIKRLLSFLFCAVLFLYSLNFISIYISLPLLLLTFSILHSRITGEKPPHLFAFYRTENYFKKGGLRDFIRILVTLSGFIYDTVIWTVWGIYLVFILFIDLIDFLKTIIYWILHAVLWFFRQYVPFFVFLYILFIHYLIRWPWWLYQIAYNNIRNAFNLNAYKIALWGTLLSGFIIFLFYFLELMLEDIPGVTYIGVIIGLLPLTWSYGEIANLRAQKLEKESYSKLKSKFQNGMESVRSTLFYITLFVVLLLVQLGLNLLGWIPGSGIVIAGFMFNVNTFISLILVFLAIIIVFGVIFIPSYRIFNSFSEISLKDSADLLKAIFRKILQYFTVSIPVSFFSLIAVIIPFFIIFLVTVISLNIKNSVVDIKINVLKTEQATTKDAVEAFAINKRIDQLEYLKVFPGRILQEFEHRKITETEIAFAEEDFRTEQQELLRTQEETEKKLIELQSEVTSLKLEKPNSNLISELSNEAVILQNNIKEFTLAKQIEIEKLDIQIKYLKRKNKQIPALLFFGGLWLVLFGGMVAAFITAYTGNVYHQVYLFRNDNEKSVWIKKVREIKGKDSKQPLLGGTLFILTIIIIYIVLTQLNVISSVTGLFGILLSY